MSTIDSKQLAYAALSGPIFVPGIGQLDKTLSAGDSAIHKGVKMTIAEPWVIVEVKDKVGKLVTIPIPITSFTHTVLAKT